MRKDQELSDPQSCLNKARPDELVFVLLGRDPAAADTIHLWCKLRVDHGKNKWEDEQISEALEIACAMDLEAKK